MTLSFIPKMVGIFVMLIFAGPWMIMVITNFMRDVFLSIPYMAG